MKRPILALLVAGTLLQAQALPARPQGGSRWVEVQIEGMACPFCVYGVEKHLKRIPGVQEVEVELGTGETVLTLKPGAEVKDEQIREAVRKAGFKASEIKAIQELPGGQDEEEPES